MYDYVKFLEGARGQCCPTSCRRFVPDNEKEIISCYGVDIAPGNDDILILAITVIIDEALCPGEEEQTALILARAQGFSQVANQSSDIRRPTAIITLN